jgi:hypothetical protein
MYETELTYKSSEAAVREQTMYGTEGSKFEDVSFPSQYHKATFVPEYE